MSKTDDVAAVPAGAVVEGEREHLAGELEAIADPDYGFAFNARDRGSLLRAASILRASPAAGMDGEPEPYAWEVRAISDDGDVVASAFAATEEQRDGCRRVYGLQHTAEVIPLYRASRSTEVK